MNEACMPLRSMPGEMLDFREPWGEISPQDIFWRAILGEDQGLNLGVAERRDRAFRN